MQNLNLSGLNRVVADKISPMLKDLLDAHPSNILSIHITGSAVIPDYDEKLSDINSVVVLNSMDMKFLTFLAPLGKQHGKKRIAAPLVMTEEYINSSLDAFPIEFLDFKLIHHTVYGADILKALQISRHDLRVQCEREIKTKLISLRQGYISSLGKRQDLSALLVRSITGSMALFRAIIFLQGIEPPIARPDVIEAFSAGIKPSTAIFKTLLLLKSGQIKPTDQELTRIFEDYHSALESAGKIIDDLPQ